MIKSEIHIRKDDRMGIFIAIGILILIKIYDAIDMKLCDRRFKNHKEELKRLGLYNDNKGDKQCK